MTMQMYNAEVEVDRKALTKDTDIDAAIKQLASYHVALSGSPRGWATARISLPAESLGQACTTAAVLVAAALGGQAIACEAMTEAEFLAREGWDTTEGSEMLSVTQAAELLSVSRQRVLQLIASRDLPSTRVGRGHTIPQDAVMARLRNRPHGEV